MLVERIAANVTVESDNNMVTVHVNTKNSDNQAASGSKLYLLADAIRIKRISSDIALTKYAYDHRNLLTKVENFSDTAGTTLANATDYYYDVLGRRVGKEHTAGSAHSAERFVLDGNQIAMIEEVDSDNNLSQTRHLWATAVDQLLALDETSTPSGGNPDHKKTTWTLPDHQGTVKDYMGRKDATEESKLLYTVQTSPFGTPVGGKAWVDQATLNEFAKVDSGSRFIYTGQYFDIETGLQYARARYYDPGTREFISPDDWELRAGDPNFYRRVGNSPVNATDPTGNFVVLGALVGLNYFLWKNNAAALDDLANGRNSDPSVLLYNYDANGGIDVNGEYLANATLATGVGALAGAALPALAAGLPAWVTVPGVVGLSGYGVYQEGGAALEQFRQGNYFSAAFHTASTGTVLYGGARGLRSLLPQRGQLPAGVTVEAEGPFGTGVVTVQSPRATSVAYASAGLSTTGAVQAGSRAAITSSFIAPRASRPISKIGDLTKDEAAALRNIWQGGPRSQLPLRTREQLAELYSGVARKNPAGSAQSAFNQARADYLLGRGPNPGKDVNAFAERFGLENSDVNNAR